MGMAISYGTSSTATDTDTENTNYRSTSTRIEPDNWRVEKLKREFDRLINKIRSIIEIKKIETRHQIESKQKIQMIWFRQPLYYLKLSKNEWSGRNFCKV